MGVPVGVHTYVKKPSKVQAIRYSEDNIQEIEEFTESRVISHAPLGVVIELPSGPLRLYQGQYLIKDGSGNFSTADPVYFTEIYQFA